MGSRRLTHPSKCGANGRRPPRVPLLLRGTKIAKLLVRQMSRAVWALQSPWGPTHSTRMTETTMQKVRSRTWTDSAPSWLTRRRSKPLTSIGSHTASVLIMSRWQTFAKSELCRRGFWCHIWWTNMNTRLCPATEQVLGAQDLNTLRWSLTDLNPKCSNRAISTSKEIISPMLEQGKPWWTWQLIMGWWLTTLITQALPVLRRHHGA